MSDRNSSEGGVSRRQTLAAVTGATVSGLAGVPTTVVGDSGREKRITILASGDESRETVTVSKRWYRHKEQAIRVKEAMSRQYLGEGSVHSVGIESSDAAVGDLRGKRVRVAASPEGDASVLDAVPSSVEGIPVRTVERKKAKQTACYNDSRDDDDNDGKNEIYGGMACLGVENAETTDEQPVKDGTLCCRVYKNGTKYMLTARHIINRDNCNDPSITDGSYAWGRPDSGGYTRLGGISHAYQKFDAALVNRRFPKYDEFTHKIAAEASGGIIGRVTGDGIDVLSSEPLGEVRKRGQRSCATVGKIESAKQDNSYCIPSITEKGQVETTATQKDTDSGGPVYVHRQDGSNPDNLYLLNIATREIYGNALGSSADVMYSEEGITFGNNSFDL